MIVDSVEKMKTRNLEISLVEVDPAIEFYQISGTGERALEDVVETALLQGIKDLKVVVECISFISLN